MKMTNTIRKWITLVLLANLFLLSGCNSVPENASPGEESPPSPIIQTSSGITIPAVQGSYCWGNRCVDYAGDMELLEGKTPVPVLGGENVSIDMDTDIPPDEFILVEYVDGEASPISYTNGSFQLPQESGTHYYGAFVRWSSPQDSQVSLGDTSFAFVVRVVEKK